MQGYLAQLTTLLAIALFLAAPYTSIPAAGAAPTVPLTVTTRYLDDASLTGMWTVLRSGGPSGPIVATGFSPITFNLNLGEQYMVSVANYRDITFHHWLDTNSAVASRPVSISEPVTFTAFYVSDLHPPPSKVQLNVNAATEDGALISGVYTVILRDDAVQIAENTPVEFLADYGVSYTVRPSDYEVFSSGSYSFLRWEDGSTGRTRAFTLTQPATFTAVYHNHPAGIVSVSVRSVNLEGDPISGLYFDISPSSSNTIKPGYSPRAYTLEADDNYTVTPQDYGSYKFSHWEDGSTTRSREFTPVSGMVLTAYFELKPPEFVPVTHYIDTTNTYSYGIYTAKPARAEYITPTSWLVGKQIDEMTVSLRRVGAITGVAQAGVFNADGSVKRLFGTVDVASVRIPLTQYTFKTDSLYTIAAGDRIGIRYTGGSSSSYLAVALDYDPVDPFDGANSYLQYYQNGWREVGTDKDLWMILKQTKSDTAFSDNLPPQVALRAPADGRVVTSRSATVAGTASDNVGITKIEVAVDGGSFTKADGLVKWSYLTPELSPGGHTATVRAYDMSGNFGQKTVSFTINPHPILDRTGVYIPMYMSPVDNPDHYAAVAAAKAAHPSVPVVVAINPDSGPGPAYIENYDTAIDELRAAGVIVLGYTPTKYGSRPSDEIKADIDRYLDWYRIDGLMLDEFPNRAGYEAKYAELTAYAKSYGLRLVIGNAGTDVPQSYVGTVDVIGITEGHGYMPTEWLRYCVLCLYDGWHQDYNKNNFRFSRYAIDKMDPEFVRESSKWVGLFYITDGVSPDRWKHLSPYFDDMMSMLDK